MKILAVSDTHRKNDNYFDVLKKEKPDLVIHCGDAEGSEYALTESAKCPVKVILGNNDFFSDLPRELEFEVGKYKIWVTHGHNYYVSMGYADIHRVATVRGKDIVLFGHTHRPVLEKRENVWLINPGSLSYPRQEGHKCSYAVLEIDNNGEGNFEIKYV